MTEKRPTPTLLEKLREFLSTDMRRQLFLYYVFKKTAPSDLAESIDVPLSTVDMITNSLRLMELLREVEGEDKNKNYYEVDMEVWLTENLRALDLDFISKEQKEEMLKIIGDKQFLALSFILTDPDFAMALYKEPLKMGDDLIVFKLMKLFKRASLVSDMLSYILMSVLIFPSFKQLKENIFSEQGLKETIELINTEASKYPFLADTLKNVNADVLKEYNKKRAAISALMERLVEQELQILSTKQAKEVVESEESAQEKADTKVSETDKTENQTKEKETAQQAEKTKKEEE